VILCDREIQALLDDGQLLIDPRPPVESPQWSSTSLDLRLERVIVEWEPKMPAGGGPIAPIQPNTKNFNVQNMMEDPHYARRVEISKEHGYLLHPPSPYQDLGPGTKPKPCFVLGFTREKVRFPNRCRVAARVEGKSSLARLGLGIHVTAPTIHAGFGAKDSTATATTIQLEIFNLGPWTIRLDYEMPICQLILEEVREVPSAGYSGQFNSQRAFTV
jgi:dCTP deaminase